MKTISPTSDHQVNNALQRVIAFYETLTPESLNQISEIYHEKASFKDPFNEVQGQAAITHIFAHMFQALGKPQFKIQTALGDERQAFLIWDFYFSKKPLPDPMCIQGATYLVFADDGRILKHEDYWDANKELLSKLPWLGSFFRLVTRQFKTPSR